MLYPPASKLKGKVGDNYSLCIIVAKRARQLLEGASPLIQCDSKKPVTIAINEVYEDKITFVRTKSGIK